MAAGSLSAGTLVFCDLILNGVPPGDLQSINVYTNICDLLRNLEQSNLP